MPAQTTANNTNNLNNEKQRQQHRFDINIKINININNINIIYFRDRLFMVVSHESTVSEYPGQEGVRAITIKLVDEDHTRHLSRQIIRGGFCLNPMSLPSQYSRKEFNDVF